MTGPAGPFTRWTLALLAAAIALAVAPAAASAAVFTVTTTADNPGSTCAPGNCSLRQAINAANAADGNTVSIPAGRFVLNTGATPFGELRIAQDMTITGAGARSTIVDANGKSRAFEVDFNNAAVTFN